MATIEKGGSRWLIASMGTVLMLCLGTVYAWSFFQGLLVRELHDVYGWSNARVAWIFCLAIFFLGATAAWAGSQLPKRKPRNMAMLGALLFAAGYGIAAAAFALKSLPLLYIGYGVIGGIGAAYQPIFVQEYDTPAGHFYRVRVGRVASPDAAQQLAAQLRASDGFQTFVMRLDQIDGLNAK